MAWYAAAPQHGQGHVGIVVPCKWGLQIALRSGAVKRQDVACGGGRVGGDPSYVLARWQVCAPASTDTDTR